ncbi:MAG TPA: PAS domain S-box protein [Fibrobacteria bacterium]|nr:PAS domain S-box protein [Fibrobacteria bacterium]
MNPNSILPANSEESRRIQLVLEATSDGIFDWHIPSGECYFSARFYNMLGYEEGEFPGHFDSWCERLFPDDLVDAKALLEQHFADERIPYKIEFRMRQKDGSWKWILARGKVVEKDSAARPVRMIGTHIDISERKAAEERYRQLIDLAENSLDIILRLDAQGRYLWVSPSIRTILGEDPDALVGTSSMAKIHPDDHPRMEEAFRSIASGSGVAKAVFRHVKDSGESLWLESIGKAIRDPSAGIVREILVFTRDITERKLAEERYRKLFENLTTGFALHEVILDDAGEVVDYRFLEVNPAYERMTGLRAQDLIGRTVKEALPGVESYWIDNFGRVALTGEPLRMENYTAPLDRWYETWAYRPASNQFAVLVADITKRRRQEDAIRLSEMRFREVADMSLDMLSRHDLTGNCLWVSPASRQIVGLDPDAVVGTNAFGFIVDEDRSLVRSNLESLMVQSRSSLQYRLQRADGSVIWVESLWSLTRNADGSPLEIHSSTRDITERKEALRRIEALAGFNQQLIDTTGGIIVVFDRFGRIHRFNHAAEDLLGWKEEEVLGKPFFDLFLPRSRRDEIAKLFPDAFDSFEPKRFENDWIARDGSVRWIAWANSRIKGPSGAYEYVVSTGLDRTLHRKTEQELLELNGTLERKVQERTEELQSAIKELESFSYSISHDLRSPLRAIDGFSLALIEDAGPNLAPELRNYLDRIRSASGHMAHLIDDLLELSRSSRVEIRKSEVDLTSIAHEILEGFHNQNPERSLFTKVDPDIRVQGDPVLVRSILDNLLGNSWKYSSTREEAVIEVTSEIVDGRRWVQIQDNGIGFDMEHAGKLFGTFQRLHPGKQFEGTGIGLATVKKLVERHGGTILGAGTPDKGAVFKFTLDPLPENSR